MEVNDNATAVIKDNSGGNKLVHQSRLKPLFETVIWGDEEGLKFRNVDETKTMRNQHQKETDNTVEAVGGWGQFEELAEEEEEPPPTPDEPATSDSNRSANRRGSLEEENQWETTVIPPTNDRTEPEGRPRLRDRSSINAPAKLDL